VQIRRAYRAEPMIEATDWRPGKGGVPVAAKSDAPKDGVRWIEVNASAGQTDAVLDALPGWLNLQREMVEDLVTPDQAPQGKEYDREGVRLTSSCRIDAKSEGSAKGGDAGEVGGHITIQQIELLRREGVACHMLA
jgi:hypothetical protein